MKKKKTELPWNQLKTYSVKQRPSKVKKEEFAQPLAPNPTMKTFLNSLPQILAAKDLRAVIAAMAEAHRGEKMIVLAMGAHVIKVGLNPLIIDLMERGIVSALALNGAGIIHDFELAFIGQTSEDVAPELEDGTFGMAEETASYLNGAISKGAAEGIGIGEAVGKMILSGGFPHTGNSLLAAAARLGIPATVHVAIGTDIIHMHPSADGAAIGKGSYLDFKRYTEVVADLEGGVYFNIGSAVLLPEIFLKALSIARNLGRTVQNFTVVNMDFIQHYRPITNVVKRPTQKHGKGYALTGHHEIMLPLLIAGLLTELEKKRMNSAKRRGPARTKSTGNKRLALPALQRKVRALQRQGKKIVFTNGCFDLLHVGHVRYLAAARALGDCLVVAINSDASVRRLKGSARPIVPHRERMEVLAALGCVDYVVLFNANTPQQVIDTLVPDILVKGGDWALEEIVGRETVEQHGGKVVRVKTVPGASTTGIIERILKRSRRG